MKKNYTCDNFGECEFADTFKVFELEEHEDKCPKCGRDDTLIEDKPSGSGSGGGKSGNYILNKLKNPLVAGIIGGTSLIGGGGYYCFLGGGDCFNSSKDRDINKSVVGGATYIKPIENNDSQEIQLIKEKFEKEKQDELEKEKRERQVKLEREKRERQVKLEREKRERQARLEKEKNRAYSLIINTNPSNAKVRILTIKPKYYDGIKVKNGTHKIEVSANGYYTKTFTINVRKNKTINIFLKAKPKPMEIIEDYKPSYVINESKSNNIIHKSRTISIIVPKENKSCRNDLNQLRRYINEGNRLEAGKLRLEISRSNRCSDAESQELLKLSQ